jgi:hypothetical protein
MSEDEFEPLNVEEKETQTGCLSVDNAAQTDYSGKSVACQTGRLQRRVNVEDT